ncbi:MAG: hypothetical protein M1840_009055 [Geoglossum simile]|nr:MAG: hypothetical protein M1840_009055 [Geoglossum simile]
MEYISPAAIGAGATIKLIEVSLRLTNVENETSDFIKIVSAIGTDLNEAIRLRNAHRCSLDTHSLHRTDTVILNTESAMSGVATLVEDPRVDVRERGKVGMGNKLLWTFKDSHEMNTKQAYLTTCHQSLLSVIAELKGREREERQTRAPPPYGGLPGYEEDGRDLIAALKREHSGSKKRSYGGQSQKSQQLPTPPFSPPAERLHGTFPTLST